MFELIFEGIISGIAAIFKGFESENKNVRLLCFAFGTNFFQLVILILLVLLSENPAIVKVVYFLPFLIGIYLAYFHEKYTIADAIKYIFASHILVALFHLSCYGFSRMYVL
jgi:hypothetical protein